MNDTVKILLIAGAAGAAGFWYCDKRKRKNPDEEMEELLTQRINQLDSSPRMNPHQGMGSHHTTDSSLELEYLRNKIDRLERKQRLREMEDMDSDD